MTNKIEISRELAQKVDDLLYILTGHDSHPKMIRKYGEEFWIPIDQLRAELCTAIAAPSVERQEPVGFRYRAHGGHWEWMDESPFADGREHYKLGGEELQPLYTSPPAPVTVVLPERKPIPDQATFNGGNVYYAKCFDEARSWNACLDKVKELNQ